MKVLIVSDTHKHHENLELVLSRIKPIDCMIHLGDAEGYEDYIRSICECPLYIVQGNCDWFSNLDREMNVMLGRHNIFMTHGHYYYVTVNRNIIMDEARARGSDIVMYGHTHVPLLEYRDGLTILNPGSLSFPRQEGRKPSYAMMEIDKDGEAHFTISYLEK
jgi:hypothetical protein